MGNESTELDEGELSESELDEGELSESEPDEGELDEKILSDELFKTISSNGRSKKKSEWQAWKKENKPQVSRGNMRFKSVDKNKNNGIGKSEFFKFYKRLIKD